MEWEYKFWFLNSLVQVLQCEPHLLIQEFLQTRNAHIPEYIPENNALQVIEFNILEKKISETKFIHRNYNNFVTK